MRMGAVGGGSACADVKAYKRIGRSMGEERMILVRYRPHDTLWFGYNLSIVPAVPVRPCTASYHSSRRGRSTVLSQRVRADLTFLNRMPNSNGICTRLSTPQTASSPSSSHYPCPDHTDGLYSGSPAQPETLPRSRPPSVLSSLRPKSAHQHESSHSLLLHVPGSSHGRTKV